MVTELSGGADGAEYLRREAQVVRKVMKRLLPFLFLLYVVAYLDRVNVGFAKLEMNALPWFSETVFGLGSGIFFIGYFLFEVPSNLILQRVGARKWIMRIMLSWGVVAMGMMFVQDVTSFYSMRFLLGIAEAGFFPGMLLYLTYWFTSKERARVIALFMTANAVAFIFGGPLSGILMSNKIIPGLAGWQQMFLLEGFPAIVLGFVVLKYLPNGPRDATWLTQDEKNLIGARIAREEAEVGAGGDVAKHEGWKHLGAAMKAPALWLLCATFVFLVISMYGFNFWLPQIVKGFGTLSNMEVGFLTAVPHICAAIAMVCNGWHSDQTGERGWHIAVPCLVAGIGLIGCAYSPSPAISLLCLSVAAAGMWSTLGPFWSLPPRFLRRFGPAALAGGLALVNSVGNLGGFLGPAIVGFIKERTSSFSESLLFLMVTILIGGGLALVTARSERRTAEAAQAAQTALTAG